MDRLEQVKRLPGLVGLQRPDQMQVNPLKTLAKLRPLSRSLLNAVLPETAMPHLQHRLHPLIGLHLGDRDQRHAPLPAPRLALGFVDAVPDVFETHLRTLRAVPTRTASLPQPHAAAQSPAADRCRISVNSLPHCPTLDSRREKQCRIA